MFIFDVKYSKFVVTFVNCRNIHVVAYMEHQSNKSMSSLFLLTMHIHPPTGSCITSPILPHTQECILCIHRVSTGLKVLPTSCSVPHLHPSSPLSLSLSIPLFPLSNFPHVLSLFLQLPVSYSAEMTAGRCGKRTDRWQERQKELFRHEMK